MKKIILQFVILFLLTLPVTAWGTKLTEHTLNMLIELSGVTEQIESMPDFLRSSVIQNLQQQGECAASPQEIATALGKINNFKASDATRIMRSTFHQSITEEEAQTVLSWLTSDLGKKITKAEKDASSPGVEKIIQEQYHALLNKTDLLKAAKKIDQTSSLSEQALSQYKKGIEATMDVMGLSKEQSAEGKAALEKQMPTIQSALEQYVQVSLIYTYQDFTTKELDRYIDFLKTPQAKKMNKALFQGLENIFNQAQQKMAPKMAKVVKKLCTKKQ